MIRTIAFLKYTVNLTIATLFRMKSLLLSLLIGFSSALFSQSLVPTWFTIEDDETHKTIPGAMVSIKQAGYDTKPTGGDGRVKFENVPVGQIDFHVMKDGYQFQTGQVNVSAETKNNTFRISLFKMPSPKDPTILITGEVNDAEGHDVEKALVEVKIADVVRTVETDAGGNYSLDIVPNPNFPANTARIEVKKGNCKKTDILELTGAKVFYKDLKLDCAGSGNGGTQSGTSPASGVPVSTASPLAEKTIAGIRLAIDRCEQRTNTFTIYYTLENMTASPSIRETRIDARQGELIDQDGNGFYSNYVTIGNNQGSGYVGAKIIYGTPVKGSIQFDVGAIKVSRVAMFQVNLFGHGNAEFTNVRIK